MRLRSPSLLIVGCALWTAACTPHSSIYADRPAAELHQIKVFAGDHLEIDHQEITLADAETPQPQPNAACRAEEISAAHAADVVRSKLTGAQHLEVHPGPGDRQLVNIDGLDLGQALIREGLAVSRGSVAMKWCFAGGTSG
jgi:hypothetical protein